MENVSKFFAFARERHNIYLRRQAGKPRPYTDDKILQKYRFTNVFRELDKTTVWFAKNVRNPLSNNPDVLMATVVFRMLNRIESGEAVFSQLGLDGKSAFDEFLESGDVRDLRRAIKKFIGPKGPYVTGAYTSPSPPGYLKLDGMLKIVERFTKKSDWKNVANDMIRNKPTLQSAWEWFKDFEYFGPFNSYEIVTDLRHTNLLCNAPDIMTWANIGPGARRGLNRIAERDVKDGTVSIDDQLVEMRALLKKSKSVANWPKNFPTLEMRDIEHTLCEFDKYERVRLGQGRPRGVFS